MPGVPNFPQTLPAQTVIGNLAATPKEAQAIPIAVLSSQLADASTITFTPAGAGAVVGPLQTTLRTIVYITQYGAVGDGVVDCSTAIANARAVTGYAYVPEGLFLVSATTALGGLWGPGRIIQSGNQVLLPASIWSGYKNSNASLFVDLHYGILRGTAFVTGEVSASYSIGADVAGGATTFTSTGSVPSVGQLINYLAKDGYYHSAVAINVAGAIVTLDQPVVSAGIAASATNISAFYSNNSPHPNVLGYDTIADYPFANGLRSYGTLTYQNPVAYNGGTVTRSSGNNVIKPGGTTFPGWDVTPGGASQGCQFNFRPGKTGYHVLRLKVNTVATDLFLSVSSATAAGTFNYFSANINSDAATLYEVPVWVQKGLNDVELNITITRTAGVFYIARAELVQYEQLSGAKVNWGKHVLLGDSWFVQTGIADRLQANLPNSRVVNKGVGGDKASDLVARFATDVTPENPDFVWIMVSTNDYVASVSSDLFAYNIQRLKYLCQSIGATPIFFGPSVGSIGVSAPQFDSSRQYADLTPYIDENLLNYFDTFTGTLTGCTTSPTAAIKYSVNGDLVTLEIPQTTATSNTTACTITGVPQYLRPTTSQNCLAFVFDNGAATASIVNVGTNGTLTLNVGFGTAFTNSGTKGIAACVLNYHVS